MSEMKKVHCICDAVRHRKSIDHQVGHFLFSSYKRTSDTFALAIRGAPSFYPLGQSFVKLVHDEIEALLVGSDRRDGTQIHNVGMSQVGQEFSFHGQIHSAFEEGHFVVEHVFVGNTLNHVSRRPSLGARGRHKFSNSQIGAADGIIHHIFGVLIFVIATTFLFALTESPTRTTRIHQFDGSDFMDRTETSSSDNLTCIDLILDKSRHLGLSVWVKDRRVLGGFCHDLPRCLKQDRYRCMSHILTIASGLMYLHLHLHRVR
mmetsp:Transcript_5749/g.10023  ORF Transcript_5749/g.10023 Transcript_5749/m.10023 type:complete len:261 (+) Transcript_5749:1295-2077(+)